MRAKLLSMEPTSTEDQEKENEAPQTMELAERREEESNPDEGDVDRPKEQAAEQEESDTLDEPDEPDYTQPQFALSEEAMRPETLGKLAV